MKEPDSLFDVFLSHNSEDKKEVEFIAQWLAEHEGLTPWLDKWNLVPGEPWQEAIEEALNASKTCAVFLGASGLGPWENEEMRAALDIRIWRRDFRVIPVLLPGASLPDRGKLPIFLSRSVWVNLRDGLDDEEGLRSLAAGIRGNSPRPNRRKMSKTLSVECPFRGLEAFEETHHEIFFGRDSMTQHILERLLNNRFVAVIGPSGSGKSSLVRAGVIPRLKKGGIQGSNDWIYITLSPGSHPLNELALSLVGSSDRSLEHCTELLCKLESDERALHLHTRLALASKPKNSHLLLFVDQFEEIMTLCKDSREREQFLLNLRYSSTTSDGSIIIVITMRADFVGRAAAFQNLAEMLSGNEFVVGTMDTREMRNAIEEPAALAHMRFEDGLVARILTDAGEEPGALPLLEETLTQLYQKRGLDGIVTQQAYQELGGVHGSLAKRADTVYDGLSLEQRDIGRRVFLRLTQPGEGVEDTRRRAEMNELWPDAAHRTAVERVVETLVQSRLLTMSSQTPDERTVNVAHEALIRGWPKLRRWIDDEREGLRIHRQITETAREWRSRSRDAGYLYRGLRLDEALEWRSKHKVSLNELENEFLETSHQVQRREQRAARTSRWIAIGVLSLALVAVGGYAISLYSAKKVADRAQQIATSRRLAARAIAKAKRDPAMAARLALEAERSYRSPEAESALRQALSGFQEAAVLSGHIEAVYTADFSPDGTQLVTASADNTAKIWDARTMREVRVLEGHGGGVLSAIFSLDGNRVVTASRDNAARIWDLQTGNVLVLRSEEKPKPWETLYWANFSRDGTRMVTASADTTARIWDARSGKELSVLRHKPGLAPSEPNDKSAVVCAAFNRDGSELITGTNDGKVHVWNIRTKREFIIPTSQQKHRAAVNVVALDREGERFVTGSTDGVAWIWDAHSRQPLRQLSGHTGWIYGAAFSPNGDYVVTASTDRTVKIWDSHTGRELSELRGHSDWVYTAAFSPDGLQVATASRDKTARIWKVPVEKKKFNLPGKAKILSASFSPSRMRVVTADDDNIARIWDGTNRSIELRGHSLNVNSAAFSPDEGLVVTAGDDKTARIWNSKTGQPAEAKILYHKDRVVCAVFSPDGNQVVTGSAEDYVVRVWDVRTGQELRQLDAHTDTVPAVVFSSDGTRVVTTSRDQTALLWDWSSSGEPKRLAGHRDIVLTASFRPDGQQVATGSGDRSAIVWDLHSGDPVSEFVGHRDKIVSIAFSPDGKLVATASLDGTVCIWDASSGNQLWRRGHNGALLAVTWTDGSHLVTVGDDRMVTSYDCDVCGPVDELVKIAQARNLGPLSLEELTRNLQE